MQKTCSIVDSSRTELEALATAFLPADKVSSWCRKQCHRFELRMNRKGLSSLLEIETTTVRYWLYSFVEQQLWKTYRRNHLWQFWRLQQQRLLFNKKLQEHRGDMVFQSGSTVSRQSGASF